MTEHACVPGAALTGEPGIGRTSLLRRMADSAAGVTLLWARGDEAGVRPRVRGRRQLRAGLPERFIPPMSEPADRSSTDPLEVGGELLAMVGALQSAGPVVVVVDDARWVDESSARALASWSGG